MKTECLSLNPWIAASPGLRGKFRVPLLIACLAAALLTCGCGFRNIKKIKKGMYYSDVEYRMGYPDYKKESTGANPEVFWYYKQGTVVFVNMQVHHVITKEQKVTRENEPSPPSEEEALRFQPMPVFKLVHSLHDLTGIAVDKFGPCRGTTRVSSAQPMKQSCDLDSMLTHHVLCEYRTFNCDGPLSLLLCIATIR